MYACLFLCVQNEYIQLADKCSKFAVELVDECRTSEEVVSVLSQKSGLKEEESGKTTRFARAVFAVDYEQKEVWITQTILNTLCGQHIDWRRKKIFLFDNKNLTTVELITSARESRLITN